MNAPAVRMAACLVAWPLLGGEASAHALAQRYDLPLPLGYFLAGAGAAVAVSFLMLALFWRQPAGTALNAGSCRLDPSAVVACCQTIGIGVLALVVSAGLFGNQNTFKNIAPVSVWIIWWVGLSFLCAFVGNVWVLLNPWTALFDVAERLARPWASGLSLGCPIRSRLALAGLRAAACCSAGSNWSRPAATCRATSRSASRSTRC